MHSYIIANMSEKDYDILFASIDLDGNGTLDLQQFLLVVLQITIRFLMNLTKLLMTLRKPS